MALLNQNSGFSRWQGWAGYNFSCALTDFLQPKYMGKILLFSLVQKVQHPPIYFCPSFTADVCLAPLWVQSIFCSTLFFLSSFPASSGLCLSGAPPSKQQYQPTKNHPRREKKPYLTKPPTNQTKVQRQEIYPIKLTLARKQKCIIKLEKMSNF